MVQWAYSDSGGSSECGYSRGAKVTFTAVPNTEYVIVLTSLYPSECGIADLAVLLALPKTPPPPPPPPAISCQEPSTFVFQQGLDTSDANDAMRCDDLDDRSAGLIATLCLAQPACVAFVTFQDPGQPARYCLYTQATYPLDSQADTYMSGACQGIYSKLSPTYSLGPYGVGPWFNRSNFVDPTANWIWHNPNGTGVGPLPATDTFNEICYHSGANSGEAILHVIFDDYGTVYLNGQYLGFVGREGWLKTNYTRIPSALLPGRNVFRFSVTNTEATAGLLYAVQYVHPDTEWHNGVVCHSGDSSLEP